MLIGAAIAAIGTALQTGAQDIPTLIAGRLIAGIAIGVIYFAIPQCKSRHPTIDATLDVLTSGKTSQKSRQQAIGKS
jgi:MFS family permease